mmetsp:Transcript_30001/g.35376  ORF Transcript_30001/g.35376 Transcript_30001/m.35376 type:complete len:146 (-) Transcript_30001:350-787(-)
MIQGETVSSGKLQLWDMAGNERYNSSQPMLSRQESVYLNFAQSSLLNVVSTRLQNQTCDEQSISHKEEGKAASIDQNTSKKMKKHKVPYRSCKLTRLMQSALGGDSRTLAILTTSPSNISFEDTCYTVRFGDRLRQVKNHRIVKS